MNQFSGPPRFIPTLTEIVHLSPGDAAQSIADGPSVTEAIPVSPLPLAAPAAEMQALMVERVMQRLDGLLEVHLSGVIAQLVMEQAQTMVPLLKDALECRVRESVMQAFEEEFFAAARHSELP